MSETSAFFVTPNGKEVRREHVLKGKVLVREELAREESVRKEMRLQQLEEDALASFTFEAEFEKEHSEGLDSNAFLQNHPQDDAANDDFNGGQLDSNILKVPERLKKESLTSTAYQSAINTLQAKRCSLQHLQSFIEAHEFTSETHMTKTFDGLQRELQNNTEDLKAKHVTTRHIAATNMQKRVRIMLAKNRVEGIREENIRAGLKMIGKEATMAIKTEGLVERTEEEEREEEDKDGVFSGLSNVLKDLF